jgi:hypothetical protein
VDSEKIICGHVFAFLRQEERNVGYDRNPTYLIEDVFFCQNCCEYRRVPVRKERPGVDTFERRIVERFQ